MARQWGALPTEFLGWIRTAPAGVWSDTDRELALSLYVYESRLCSRGHDLEKSLKPEAEHKAKAETIGLCHLCVREDIEASRWENHAHGNAMHYTSELI